MRASSGAAMGNLAGCDALLLDPWVSGWALLFLACMCTCIQTRARTHTHNHTLHTAYTHKCMHVYMYPNARAHTHTITPYTQHTHTNACMHSQVAQPGRLLFSKPLNPSSPSFAPKFSPAKTHSTVASTVSSSIEAPPLSQEDEDAWLGDDEEVGVCVCVCVCVYVHT